MEKIAVPTGDVVKDMDVDREEYLFFLLKNETNEFTIGLGDILECLKFAEEQGEVPELPQEWWWKMSEVIQDSRHMLTFRKMRNEKI